MQVEIKVKKGSIKRLKLSDEEYFSDLYRNFISNSRLKLLEADNYGSYDMFKKGRSNFDSSTALDVGTAVHRMFLESKDFQIYDHSHSIK